MAVSPNPFVNKLVAYVPGEQPKEPGFVKLNTNENPYPPAPQVASALENFARENMSLNKYPDPWAAQLRNRYAEMIGFPEGQIIAGNGSDEILRMVFEAFASPGETLAVVEPTYVLYETLANMFGMKTLRFPVVGSDCTLPETLFSAAVKLLILPNPNPPYGTYYDNGTLRRLIEFDKNRLIVIDEAYIDFTDNPRGALEFAATYDNVIVTRTFSKGWSLAGGRVGFSCLSPQLFATMAKVKDSYNMNMLTQVVACAALAGADYHKQLNRNITELRAILALEMKNRGFEVPDSKGNFIFARRSEARFIYENLKKRKVLVRWFDTPTLKDGIRITIGTPDEVRVFLRELDDIMSQQA